MVATANCTMIPRETFDWAAPATAAAWHAYLYIRARRRIAFGLGFPKLSTQIYINIFVRLYFRVARMNAHPSCDRPRTRHLSFCYFIFFCGQRAWFWIKGCGVQLVSRPVVRPDQTSIPCAVHPLIRLCMLQWTLIHFFFIFSLNQKSETLRSFGQFPSEIHIRSCNNKFTIHRRIWFIVVECRKQYPGSYVMFYAYAVRARAALLHPENSIDPNRFTWWKYQLTLKQEMPANQITKNNAYVLFIDFWWNVRAAQYKLQTTRNYSLTIMHHWCLCQQPVVPSHTRIYGEHIFFLSHCVQLISVRFVQHIFINVAWLASRWGQLVHDERVDGCPTAWCQLLQYERERELFFRTTCM